jgi:NitT/TauT family transport system ATP-binding protein
MQHAPSIHLRGVSVWFDTAPQKRVLNQIDLQIGKGEFVALVGKSGCGKTTILNLLSGILAPSAGVVEINGQPVTQKGANLGYMFARDCLFPWRSALDNVELPLEVRGVPGSERRPRAMRELERVGLGSYARHYPSALSHGMRQRVALARTWVLEPEVLLMDEPFAALDAQTRLGLERDFLNQWNERQSTVIFVTHDLTEAIALADRVVVLAEGYITLDERMPFGWPRDPENILVDERFGKLFNRVRSALTYHAPEPRQASLAAHA